MRSSVLLLFAVSTAIAQQVNYNYDAAGNLVAATSASAAGPAILTQPQNQLIQSNNAVTFSVVAAGAGLSYQWLSNGVPILGATGDSLLLLNLSGPNATNFSVVISNASGVVTSTVAAAWTDANGNGIPDWWELQYFGNLNQTASGDFDHDGVANLDEYLEGTNPTNAASFNPRLVLESAHGRVSVVPSQPYYSKGQFVTLTAIPDPGHEFTGWSGSVFGTKPQIAVLMDTNKSITATFGFPLALALDNTNLLWSTGGDASWFGQAEVSQDGVASAQSGPIVSYYNGSTFVGQQTWLQTVANLAQPALLSFWWSVSARPPDALSFAVDGATLASISGEAVGWQNFQTNLVAGQHALTWTYAKGPVDIPTGVPFLDSGWVDQVSLVFTNAQTQAPSLSIALTVTNTVAIFWPAPSTGWALQENTNGVGSVNWSNVTAGILDDGATKTLIIKPPAGSRFYRLTSP